MSQQESCDNCRHGQPSSNWVRYPDGRLRLVSAYVCMKGITGTLAPIGAPWLDFPKPRSVKNPKDSCAAWKGRGR